MQDLSSKVQEIASDFFRTRSSNSFTALYKILLPETNKMLRTFLKDPDVVEDVSSKIFESLLLKPAIYLTDDVENQMLGIAAEILGVRSCDCKYVHQSRYVPELDFKTTKSHYVATCHKTNPEPIQFTDIARLWLLLNEPDRYKIVVDGKVKMVCDHLELGKSINLLSIDLERLRTCPSPFIYRPDKPFLHYYSKIIKTNALSVLKKGKRHFEQEFTDLFNGYDDDDKAQMLSNQLSDEKMKNEIEADEDKRLLNEQKYMIIYDIIHNTVPENQRSIVIDAILKDIDYAKIAQDHGLIKIKIIGGGTHTVTKITDNKIFLNDTKHKSITVSKNIKSKNSHGIDSHGNEVSYQLIDGTGCIKSRIHRFKKHLDRETATIPQFTEQCNLGTYVTYFSDGKIRMQVDVVETCKNGDFKTIYHGQYREYYSTGEIKEVGRYSLNKRQGIWYTFYKDGGLMKRGEYVTDKPDGRWYDFDEKGQAVKVVSYHRGHAGYYELYKGKKIFSGTTGSPLLPMRINSPIDEINASKLCKKYDVEFSYQGLHLEISQEC